MSKVDLYNLTKKDLISSILSNDKAEVLSVLDNLDTYHIQGLFDFDVRIKLLFLLKRKVAKLWYSDIGVSRMLEGIDIYVDKNLTKSLITSSFKYIEKYSRYLPVSMRISIKLLKEYDYETIKIVMLREYHYMKSVYKNLPIAYYGPIKYDIIDNTPVASEHVISDYWRVRSEEELRLRMIGISRDTIITHSQSASENNSVILEDIVSRDMVDLGNGDTISIYLALEQGFGDVWADAIYKLHNDAVIFVRQILPNGDKETNPTVKKYFQLSNFQAVMADIINQGYLEEDISIYKIQDGEYMQISFPC